MMTSGAASPCPKQLGAKQTDSETKLEKSDARQWPSYGPHPVSRASDSDASGGGNAVLETVLTLARCLAAVAFLERSETGRRPFG